MGTQQESVPVYIPAELFTDLNEVIRTGLKEAKIHGKARSSLRAWWDAESTLIVDALEAIEKERQD